ncbi:MAG TPA: iron-containing alcohol dehydrogenase [Opitutaceae bacterium]|nr:iron-containing alcohol dehydrogenase [Opitutaceae bacterium]
MISTTFSFPVRTRFGPNAIGELSAELSRLGISRPLVVTDGGLVKTEAFSRLTEVLDGGGQTRGWFLYSNVHPNPIERDVRECAAAYVDHHCDGVVAIGGGSAIDVGKAARLLVKRPVFDLANFYTVSEWPGLAPLVAIPTTAGTGSEVGRSSVITLGESHRKAVLFHPALLASLVILDPELTFGLPPKLTAATGADALTHCIESFTCPVFHPLCDGIALEGIRLIARALARACRDGRDVEARGHMLVAAAMGGIAFQKDLGVVHSLAHPLSTLCGLHHGLANALCLVAGMKFCAARKSGLYRRVGLACDLDVLHVPDAAADQGTIAFVEKLLADIGLQGRLRDHGVKPEMVDALAAQAAEDPCHQTNAVPVSPADLRQLYLEVL